MIFWLLKKTTKSGKKMLLCFYMKTLQEIWDDGVQESQKENEGEIKAKKIGRFKLMISRVYKIVKKILNNF